MSLIGGCLSIFGSLFARDQGGKGQHCEVPNAWAINKQLKCFIMLLHWIKGKKLTMCFPMFFYIKHGYFNLAHESLPFSLLLSIFAIFEPNCIARFGSLLTLCRWSCCATSRNKIFSPTPRGCLGSHYIKYKKLRLL